jgi:5-methylcytosine-specific restriction enzyme subunit McrC
VSGPVTRVCLFEHQVLTSSEAVSEVERLAIKDALAAGIHEGPRLFRNKTPTFVIEQAEKGGYVKSDYLIGADWLLPGSSYIQVIPKVDRVLAQRYSESLDRELSDDVDAVESFDYDAQIVSSVLARRADTGEQVHYLRMLMVVAGDSAFDEYLENSLLYIDSSAPPLPLPSQEDHLTPLLVVRFVQVLRRLVSKGLRRSYYKVTNNLPNRVKGKVLVSQHIKENVLKSRLTSVLCGYDIFGENTRENQFLKRCLRFARRYIEGHGTLFGELVGDLREVIKSVSSAFERVDELHDIALLKHTTHHPFYGEYKEAIRVGKLLLQRFGYAVNSIDSGERMMTPPFWINMPALFEMYVCAMMRAHNPELLDAIDYQFSARGNQVDILVGCHTFKAVIDTKYKLVYQRRHIHQDIRQVAGYARLRKVRRELRIPDSVDDTVDCLIMYPDVESGIDDFSVETIWKEKREVAPYYKVWKLGVKIPVRLPGAT